ncbi:MAG: histidine kinase dimerization/phospho-acceptor domain-containing protein [Vagococcus sp.]
MAIKWKNKMWLALAVLFCLGGWYLTVVSFNRTNTVESFNNYFDSRITDAIYLKENLNQLEEKKSTDVTSDQIENYRTRYGSLGNQVEDVRNQYQEKLAGTTDKKRIAELVKERDQKIKAILDNFTNDDVVKEKILTEETDYLTKHKKEIEKAIKPYLEDAYNLYQYYFKDEQTGKAYTNVSGLTQYSSKEEVDSKLKNEGTGKIQRATRTVSIYPYIDEEATRKGLFENDVTTINVSFMVKKGSVLDKQLKDQKESQAFFGQLIYLGIAFMLVGCALLFMYINTPFVYEMLKKVPVDVALILFLGLGFVAAVSGGLIYPYNLGGFNNISGLVAPVMIGLTALTISFIAMKLLWQLLMPKYRKGTMKELGQASLVYLLTQKVVAFFKGLSLRWKLFSLVMLLFLNLFGVFAYIGLYPGGLRKTALGVALFMVLVIEIIVMRRTMKKMTQLFNQPKEMLKEYEQPVSKEVSLDEMSQELTRLNQLIEVSQKDTMQSEMLKAELLTNVSHDLRTPLTSIITYGDLLTKKDMTEDERKEYVGIINKKAQRMKHLIDDLFEVTKMNNGEIVLNKEEVNLTQLLQQSVSEYSEEFEDHQLKVVFNKSETGILLPLDGERMWRVFDNMFGNAIKYSMPQTRVYLKLEQVGKTARIELKNISRHELNEEADELVEKFKRGDSSRHTEGSGLGLAIINSIVSLHEGTLEIKVDGDMFKLIVTLPL